MYFYLKFVYLEGLFVEGVCPLPVDLDDRVVVKDLGRRLADQPGARVVPRNNSDAQRVKSETIKKIQSAS